jgi:hypothetical protein
MHDNLYGKNIRLNGIQEVSVAEPDKTGIHNRITVAGKR